MRRSVVWIAATLVMALIGLGVAPNDAHAKSPNAGYIYVPGGSVPAYGKHKKGRGHYGKGASAYAPPHSGMPPPGHGGIPPGQMKKYR